MNTLNHLFALVLTSFTTVACGPSLAAMHAAAQTGRAQVDAPFHAKQTVVIDAPRAVVWQVLTDIGRWPAWQPQITSVEPPAMLAADQTFRWTNGGNTIASTLALVDDQAQLAWTGAVSVAKAIHIWRLSEATPTTTTVEVEESMDGFLLTWFYSQRELDSEVARSLANLAHAAERGASQRSDEPTAAANVH